MKLKFKIKGENQIISSAYFSREQDSFIINFWERWGFISYKQKGNQLFIKTENGDAEIRFSGNIPVLGETHEEKSQIVIQVTGWK
jgi:hypothetical protein